MSPCSTSSPSGCARIVGLRHSHPARSCSSTVRLQSSLHPKGFSSPVLIQNANEIFALAHGRHGADRAGADAGGLDLSVGAVMTLVDCVASHLLIGTVGGTPLHLDFRLHLALAPSGRHRRYLLGIAVCLATGTLAGFVNGCVVVYGRIQPIIATLATGAVYIGIALFLRPDAGRRDRRGPQLGDDQLARRDGRDLWLGSTMARRLVSAVRLDPGAVRAARPHRAARLGAVPRARSPAAPSTPSARPKARPTCPGLPIDRAKIAAFTLGGLLRRLRRPVPGHPDLVGQCRHPAGRRPTR